jgi:hypothetical protein
VAVGCAAALFACGSGSGPLVTTAAEGRDSPGVSWDQPPSTRDGTGSNCIACDVEYGCTGTQAQGTTSLELSTSTGQCTQTLIDLVCSGALFGASSCSGGGGGAFTCGKVTCTPQMAQQTPLPGGSSGFGADGG